MNKPVKFFLAVFIITVLTFALSARSGYNIILPLTAGKQSQSVKAGTTVKVLSDFDFDKGNWAAYLFIKNENWQGLPPSIIKRNCLKTTDRLLLKHMQNNWVFKVSDGDMATVSSSFYLVHNGKIVYQSAIMLDAAHQGLQNKQYGWMEPVNPTILVSTCSKFRPVYWPIVIL